jgi:hypothetical protein
MRMTKKAEKERQYYGCKHCGSWCIVSLSSCIGDSRDGIRNDYQCKTCGGVYGSAAHGHVFIDASEWMDATGEEMPRPNQERKLAMQILIALEEQHGFRFKSKELKVLESIVPLIEEHHQKLLACKQNAVARLKQIRRIA